MINVVSVALPSSSWQQFDAIIKSAATTAETGVAVIALQMRVI